MAFEGFRSKRRLLQEDEVLQTGIGTRTTYNKQISIYAYISNLLFWDGLCGWITAREAGLILLLYHAVLRFTSKRIVRIPRSSTC